VGVWFSQAGPSTGRSQIFPGVCGDDLTGSVYDSDRVLEPRPTRGIRCGWRPRAPEALDRTCADTDCLRLVEAEKDAQACCTKTRDIIKAAYGEGEAALLLDSSGYRFYGDGSPKSDIKNWIAGQMRRITELLPRTDTLIVRIDFDSKRFD
jgi:hypothetical protein